MSVGISFSEIWVVTRNFSSLLGFNLRGIFYFYRIFFIRIKEDTIYKIKRFVRVYWEIRKSLHNSNYVLNVDKVSAKEKSETIKTILRDNKEHTQKEVDELYFQVITREITDMEKDVQNIS